MFYWLMKYVVIGPVVKAVFRPWIVGRANVPRTGAAILASNHLSFADSIFLPLMIDRSMSFLAKSDYFTGRGLKGWSTKFFMKATGQLPIDRSGGKASEASLNTGLQVLGGGDLLGIYPEGTRSPDGKLYRGRTGIARMALEAKVPVIPVVMVDTDTAMPIGQRIRGSPASASSSASRWTSRGTRAWRTTVTSSDRSPTRSWSRCSGSVPRSTKTSTRRL